jgi:predicted Zn-dependent peptidase
MRAIFAFAAIASLAACLPEKDSAGMHSSAQGIEFAYLPMPDADVVSILVAWPQPWATAPARNRAVPHLAPDLMLAGGAEGFAPGALMEDFADMGAEANLYTQFDALHGSLTAPPDVLDAAVAAANAVLRAPSFDAGWLDRLRSDLAARQNETNAVSDTQGFYALRLGMLGDVPYTEHISLMDTGAILAVTPDDLVQWHSETLVRAGMRVAVAGPISAANAAAAVDALLANLPSGTAEISPPRPNFAQSPAKTILLHLPSAQKTTLALAAPLPPSGTDADAADLIGSIVLGGDENSLLFQAIRTDLRASYSMGAGLDNFSRAARILVMSGEVETASLAAAKEAALAAYAQMQTTAIAPDMLSRWRDLILEGLKDTVSHDSFAMATGMLEAQLDGVDPMTVQRLTDIFGAVTTDAILSRYANDYPAPDEVWVLAVSNDANALPGACVITDPRAVQSCP